MVKAPSTSTSFPFYIDGNESAELSINGHSALSSIGVEELVTFSVTEGSFYWVGVNFSETICCGAVYLKWQDSSTLIPASNFYLYDKVGSHKTVTIQPTSVPADCTVDGDSSFNAGNPIIVTLNSNNSAGTTHVGTNDVFTVTLVSSDGSVETLPVSNQGSGIFKANHTSTIAGIYNLEAHLNNDYTDQDSSISTSVGGSPYMVTIYPDQIDPTLCFTNVPSPTIPQQIAGVPFTFNIQFVDIFSNLHFESLSDELDGGMIVLVEATYVNHDDWPSPIEVPDDSSWMSTYGTVIQGTVTDSDNGMMAVSLNIHKAGDYTLAITVDGIHISDSPRPLLQVIPSSLNAPNCVAVGVPESTNAGFSYQFLIQARDSYNNNIAVLLEDAVSTLYSAQISNEEDLALAHVKDKLGYDGVFEVDISVPETLGEGEYDWEVLLGSGEVLMPLNTIGACSNFVALDFRLIGAVGNTVEIEVPEYVIGADIEEVALPTVDYYCTETHQPIQYFVSATLISAGGTLTELFEEELEDFGLVLLPHGKTPSLTLFTDDLGLVGQSLEVMLSATVVEEPTWETKVKVTFNFVGTPYEHQVREEVDIPQFDLDSVSDSTLQMKEDEESGAQFFTPVFLICLSEWSLTLPKIVGEDQGEKIVVSVDLDTASNILGFEPMTRGFKLLPNIKRQSTTAYAIKITIKNSRGLKSTYRLSVSYRQCLDDSDANGQSSFILRYDENPPTPIIKSISQFGEVVVKFNDTMAFSKVLGSDEPNFPQLGEARRRRLQDSPGIDVSDESLLEGEVVGSSSQDFKNFSIIHNSTFLLNGQIRPSIEVSLVQADPETSCSDYLGFNWELTGFTSTELTIQLSFETPVCVSGASNEQDVLVITFFDQRLFASESDKLILPETTVKTKIKRQIEKGGGEEELVASMTTAAAAAVATTGVVSIILGVLLKGAMKRLLNVVKSLQIILHMMLIQIILVAHTEQFLESLQGIVFANLYDREKISQMGNDETTTPQDGDVNDEQAASVQETQEVEKADSGLAVDPVTISMIALPLAILVIYLSARYCLWAKIRGICKKQEEKTLFNRVYLFFDGSLLVFLVSSTITVYQFRVGAFFDILNFYCSIIFVLLTIPVTLALVGYLLYHFKELGTKKMQDHIGAAYGNFEIKSKSVMVFLFLTFARRIALCFIVTLGRTNTIAQLGFMNYSSLALIAVISSVRPFAVRSQNVVELANESSILLLFSHCLTQTEFVQDPKGRWVAGWSLNGLIIINVAGNMTFILVKEGSALCRQLRLRYLKQQTKKKHEAAKQRKIRVDEYRSNVLKEFAGNGADDLSKDLKSSEWKMKTNKTIKEQTANGNDGQANELLKDFVDSSLSDAAHQDSDKSVRLSSEESSIAMFRSSSLDNSCELPQAKFDIKTITVKTKTTGSFFFKGPPKQHVLPEDRKLLDLQPINFRLTSTLRIRNDKKDQTALMSTPGSIEAVKQARIRQMDQQQSSRAQKRLPSPNSKSIEAMRQARIRQYHQIAKKKSTLKSIAAVPPPPKRESQPPTKGRNSPVSAQFSPIPFYKITAPTTMILDKDWVESKAHIKALLFEKTQSQPPLPSRLPQL